MQIAKFNARCPAEIGDRLITSEPTMSGSVRIRERVITDIAVAHYLRDGRVVFFYELDNNGRYVRLTLPGEAAASRREDQVSHAAQDGRTE